MKKICLLFAFICATTSIFAQSGRSCEDPIPVDSNYVGTVDGPGTIWYTTGTYDLPLHVFFMPASDTSTVSPTIMVDFTCTPGVYDDPKVDNLLTMVEDFGYDFPITLTCDKVRRETVNGDTVNAWDLSINSTYREQMAAFGITYNVQAFIKVTFVEGGSITMSPDTAFQACMDNAQYLHLDDTVTILANDPDRSFVLPFTDWQNDSVRFVWLGEGETEIYVAQGECDFEPNTSDSYVWDLYTVKQGQPYKLYSHQMKDAISQWSNGGLFYGKIIATKPGKLVIEKIPMGEIAGDATLLEYGKSIQLPANNADVLYCFPKTWGATQWETLAYDSVEMYLSATPDFEASSSDANVFRTVAFDLVDGKRSMYYSGKEMSVITNKAESDYIYVRFLSKKATKLTVDEWLVSECVDNSTILNANVEKSVNARANTTIFRVRYDDFSNYPLTINWSGNSAVTCYIADTCSFTFLNDPHVVYAPEIARKNSKVVDVATVNSWASRVDADGFLYVIVYSERTGKVTFVTEKPAPTPEPEPEPEPEPVQTLFPLVFDESINLEADNVDNTYYITRDWANLNIEFVTNSPDSVYAYFATAAEFDLDSQDPNFLAVYPFYRENGQSSLQLSAKQLNGLLDATSDTLFVVFHAFYNTQLTTYKWNACACVENSLELRPNDQHALIAYATNTVFRVKYSQWQDRDVTLLWNSNINLKAYLADTCDFKLTYSNKHVLNKKNYEIAANSSISIGKDVRTEAIDKGKLPDNGFLYFRFVSTEAGLLTTSFIQNGSGSTTDVDDVTLSPSYQLYIDADGRMYLYVDGKRYNILGQVVD